MMKKKNVVYILGAGSSKNFGLPLGNEFFSYAYKVLSYEKKSNIKAELESTLSTVERYLGKFFSNLPSNKKEYPPFEEVLTFIWNSGDSISLFEIMKDRVLDNFIKMMGLTIAESILFYCSEKDFSAYGKFIKSLLISKDNISFISLNYDIIIDTVLDNCVKKNIITDFHYGLPIRNLSDGRSCRKKGILLLKPHGSLNLSFCSCSSNPDTYFYYKDNIFTGIVNTNSWYKCPDCKTNPPKPLIVPPLYNKGEYIGQHKGNLDWGFGSSLWWYRKIIDFKIIEILKRADEIIIIGYSMPSYDVDFKSLLIRGLMQNKNRKEIPIKIITKKESQSQIDSLVAKFKYLAGKVDIIGEDGFYNYIIDK